MYWKMAVSACRRVSQDLRQASSALIVLERVRRIRKQSGDRFPDGKPRRCHGNCPCRFDDSRPCSRRILWSSCEGYWLPRLLWKMQPQSGDPRAVTPER